MRTDRHTAGPTDRQTDMKKLRVAFRNFVKAPKMNRVSTFFADISLKFSDVFLLRKACGTLH
jgi:inhibitor of KinA sporulation pathway (predicted exonuclease)